MKNNNIMRDRQQLLNAIQDSTITRREFLQQASLVFGGLALTSCDPVISTANEGVPGPLGKGGSPEKIVIIGAGISGLVAGYELFRAGHQVTILEARDRIGGRILTLRNQFSEGLYAEAGASRIPLNHHFTHWYIEHFGLSLDPFYPKTGNYTTLFEQDKNIIPAQKYILDGLYPGSSDILMDFTKIRGGMENLSLEFSKALGKAIQLSTPVIAIKQTEHNIEIQALDGRQYTADKVICTIPLPVMENIQFSPPLTREKQEAIHGGYNYGSSTRIFFQFSERFWKRNQQNGWAETDWPEEIWHPTWDTRQEQGILLSYLRNDETAKNADSMNADVLIEQTLKRLNTVIPNSSKYTNIASVHSWAREKWSGEAWAQPTHSQHEKLAVHIGKAEGRIHFAGEHISAYHGWIQGSLISGLRAAREIHQREK